MMTLIKFGCKYEIPKNSITSMDSKYDGIIIVLNDGTELRFNMSVSPQLQSVIQVAKNCEAAKVTVNLDNAIAGRYDNVLSLN